ncbi:MAG: GGDEF domain-containing protein, partial [Candidatus Eremiobacteraeota bacterium]|nr:GGDEF domain-containing protein [Candidatus Eremiobacteraeota bacterium]
LPDRLGAIAGADTLTLIFYGIFFADRLVLDLVLTTVIVIVVGFPPAYFFISQQVRLAVLAAKLDRIARTDGLTGLSNRMAFFEEAQALIDDSLAPAGSLLFIDADHFKSINDTFGHATGDSVLRELGAIIRSCIRGGDLAARIGGEEFAMFLTGADRNEAKQVAERIRMRTRGISGALGIQGREIT